MNNKEIKEIREVLTDVNWPVYEIDGIKVRPVEITVEDKGIVKALLCPGNVVFVPVNMRGENPYLEGMKEYNKKLVTPIGGLKYVEPVKDFLGVSFHGVMLGCFTTIEKRFQSMGIKFEMDEGTEMNSLVVLDKMHKSFPHLTFTPSL